MNRGEQSGSDPTSELQRVIRERNRLRDQLSKVRSGPRFVLYMHFPYCVRLSNNEMHVRQFKICSRGKVPIMLLKAVVGALPLCSLVPISVTRNKAT
jgi:hypothetical protein